MLKLYGGADIVLVDLDSQRVTPFLNQLSSSELERISSIKTEKHRNRFIVVRGLLRQLLGDRLSVRPESIMFKYGKYGKPMLDQSVEIPYFYFNISHHENIAVFAFSDTCEIGIDIESIRELDDADDIASYMFSIREFESYCKLTSEVKSVGFFNCWTRKEAFVKAIGSGFNYPLDSFDVSLIPGEPAKILSIRNEMDARHAWSLESFDVTPNYVVSLASFTRDASVFR